MELAWLLEQFWTRWGRLYGKLEERGLSTPTGLRSLQDLCKTAAAASLVVWHYKIMAECAVTLSLSSAGTGPLAPPPPCRLNS
mmetsp:Transcript_26807/g.68800  ORF Transcript_26807/g.68800 Transcript_26807/m.68800 type:complete len:83 (-) Transcript_26807:25-273(-)